MFPIDNGFDALQKWKAEDHFVFSKAGYEEFADENSFIDANTKNAIRGDISCFGWRSIHSTDMTRRQKFTSFDGVFLNIGIGDEIARSTGVDEGICRD